MENGKDDVMALRFTRKRSLSTYKHADTFLSFIIIVRGKISVKFWAELSKKSLVYP